METVPFTAGHCLNRTFSIWGKNLVPIALLSLVIQSPIIVFTVLFAYGDLTDKSIMTYGIASAVAGLILTPMVTGAIIYLVVQDLRGQRAGIGASVSVGLSRLFPVLGVAIVAGLLVGLGLVACIVPGIIMYCIYWLAVPVAVMETESGVGGALSRSKSLTDGYKSTIFGVIFLVALIQEGVGFGIEKVMLGDAWNISSFRTYLIVLVIVNVVLSSLGSVASAVGYHMIRSEREGVDIDELAAVFG